jgi:hypothetical protein
MKQRNFILYTKRFGTLQKKLNKSISDNKLPFKKEGKRELPIFFLEKRNKKRAYLSNT